MWSSFMNIFIFILIFINICNLTLCFNVNIRESNAIKVEPFNMQIYKRELSQFFDTASYSFNGFDKLESVPVLFPLDICILKLEGIKYATALHINKAGERSFAVFKAINSTFEPLIDLVTPNATAMDCKAFGPKGYVAIAFNITNPIRSAKEGSPIFEIAGDRIRAVQYFAAQNLHSVYLQSTGNDFFLLQTFKNTKATPNLYCPYFRWSGTTFNKVGRIPCSNARHLEPFSIDYISYVAVANYANQRGRTSTYSEIYRFEREKKKFQLFQKIRTNGAVDVRYFSVPSDIAKRQHFLIFGNSIGSENPMKQEQVKRESKNLQADSIFYMFDKGQFIPYQRLSLYAVEQFLPVQNEDPEKFLLLVASNNQDIKIYNLNDWKFEESEAQFTEGALGRGVANMRIYQEGENSYLVIANELMASNETNIFLPIFKQDEHANALRQQIIDWTKENMARLETVNVEQLKKNVQEKLMQYQKQKTTVNIEKIPHSNIATVTTKSLVYPKFHMTSNYWKALSYANQALDAFESQYAPKLLQKRDLQSSHRGHQNEALDTLKVNTLRVRDNVAAQTVNGVDLTNPLFENINAKEVIVSRTYQLPQTGARERLPNDDERDGILENLQIENLRINGKLNNYTWDNLMNNTLKRTGLQFVKVPISLDALKTERVVITKNELNEKKLNHLVSINEGDYIVGQDIQFAAPVMAKNLVIHDRLNNIHVFKNKFDVLMRKSNGTQTIQGPKRVDSIRVLESITLSGQMAGKYLESILPNKVIHDDVVLNGDYTINGNVSIINLLEVEDLITANPKVSVKDTLDNGINLNKVLENVNIKFEKPLKVNNSLVTFVNGVDLQYLIKTNTDEVQVIQGLKNFTQNLEVQKGFSEVKLLNGIDVELLEPRLLTKTTNQTIDEPMHFGKIIAKSVSSTNLHLGGKNLSDYLTKTSAQNITGHLKAENIAANKTNFSELNTNGKIFNTTLTAIYQQKSKNVPRPGIFRKSRKFHGTIFVKNLKLNSTINNKPASEIERQLLQLDGNIKYVGNFKFYSPMKITNLTFYGKLNGIQAQDFGRCWLQKSGEQNFTAPQTISSLNSENGIVLRGKLNSFELGDFYNKAYWINRNEHINSATFQDPIQLQGALFTNTLNGVRIPGDILYRSSSQPQILSEDISVQGDLFVKGQILNTTTLNGVFLMEFNDYLNGDGSDTIYVQNANFNRAPSYKTLNGHDLKSTLDNVWLVNENVDLMNHVQIDEGHFEGLLEFDGTINNMDLRYLKENYLSRSRPQDISTEFIFTNDATFKNDLNVEHVQLIGPIVEEKSQSTLDFNDFVSHTLKTAGAHQITGFWNMSEAIVHGDLKDVKINKLNLVQDVLRTDINDSPMEITATKYLTESTIGKLYVTPPSTVNGVDLSAWIHDTVFMYENYTIMGTTTLNAINLYNDLIVHGTVNNVTFNEGTLMLRDRHQVISGDVLIRNKFPEEQRILANNFENLQLEMINSMNLSEFYKNYAQVTPHQEIQGELYFTEPLLVGHYIDSSGIVSDIKWKRGTYTNTPNGGGYQPLQHRRHALENAFSIIKRNMQTLSYKLDHFEVQQVIPINATDILVFTFKVSGRQFDVIGIHSGGNEVHFYQWNVTRNQIIPTPELPFLPNGALDLLKLVVKEFEPISTDQHSIFYQTTIQHKPAILEDLLKLKKQQNGKIVTLHIENEYCFAFLANKGELFIFCADKASSNIRQKCVIRRKHISQIVAVSQSTLALLLPNDIEIWHINITSELKQQIPLANGKQIASAFWGSTNTTILAAIISKQPNSLHQATIEIYSSSSGKHFKHQQTLEASNPEHLRFSYIDQSSDLLLYVCTSNAEQPLIVYQYGGVANFQKIVSRSTLPSADTVHVLYLKSSMKHLIALSGKGKTSFVAPTLSKI